MLATASENASIAEATYRRIRSDIIFGRLAPGQKLKLDRLKEGYGTSVSTLRELLSRLSTEGLIVAQAQRGFEVSPMSAADLREVAAMRQLLECHAMEQSFAAGDLEWEGRVVSAHHKLSLIEKRLIAGDLTEIDVWKRYDWEFHRALISACGSSALLETHAAVYDKYLRYQMITFVFRGEIATQEHQKLLKFALQRDSRAAREVLVTHIESCFEHTLASGVLG